MNYVVPSCAVTVTKEKLKKTRLTEETKMVSSFLDTYSIVIQSSKSKELTIKKK